MRGSYAKRAISVWMELTVMCPKLVIAKTAADAAIAAARLFRDTALKEVSRKGFFAAAISGGETPRQMHRLLAEPLHLDSIPWKSVHIFWVDERYVPRDDPASNYGAALEDFIEKVPIPKGNVHPIPVSLEPARAAIAYEESLSGFFSERGYAEPAFDLIFLGLGSDGHTASLFPESVSDEKKSAKVESVLGGSPKVFRITLTIPLINKAARVAFLVTGKAKSDIVSRIMSGGSGLPAARVAPETGELFWLLDKGAASALDMG